MRDDRRTEVRLSKLHGLGNDFLVLLAERHAVVPAIDAPLARQLCDRRRGVGADGLIVGTPAPSDGDGSWDLDMLLRNSDGTVAEMSGNGIRCLAHAVALARGVDDLALTIRTGGGLRAVHVRDASGACTVEVAMGSASPGPSTTDPAASDALASLVGTPAAPIEPGRVATVEVGNPHLVIEVADPARVDLAVVGPRLEAAFPEGINVEFVRADGTGGLELVVWERGAGITEACGTGACAAAHAARGWGIVGERVQVAMPGGDATVVLGGDGMHGIVLHGPSVHVVELDVPGDASAVDRG